MSHTKRSGIITLLSSNFLNVFGWALLTPLYALYATELGATPQEVTFVWSFYTLLAGILMIVLGWAEDRLPNKPRLLTFGYVVQAVGVGLLFAANNVMGLVIGFGVYAVGTGFVMPIWKLLYSRKEHRGREATEWGVFHGVNALLISGAAALSGLLIVAFSFKGILGLMCAMHVGAAIISFGLKDSRKM